MFKQIKFVFSSKLGNKIIKVSKATFTKTKHHSRINPIATQTNVFLDLVKSNAYVDKTMLIKDFIQANKQVMSINCPKYFGKSTNMNMIKTFFEIQINEEGRQVEDKTSERYKLFTIGHERKPLEISSHKQFIDQYIGKHPVIYVDFSNVKGETYDQILNQVKLALHETYRSHEYLYKFLLKKEIENYSRTTESLIELNTNEVHILEEIMVSKEIKYSNDALTFKMHYYVNKHDTAYLYIHHSLDFLSQLLYNHFGKKVVVLIDDYDAPMRSAIKHLNIDITKVNELINDILCCVLKGNNTLERGLITGVSGMLRASSSTMFNNVTEYDFLNNHIFAKYYGFTSQEVAKLFDEFQINIQQFLNVATWYNGYIIQEQSLNVFNPWCILRFLQSGSFVELYLENICDSEYMKNILENVDIRNIIDQLMQEKSVKFYFNSKFEMEDLKRLQYILNGVLNPYTDLFFLFLFELGYISYASSNFDNYYKLPNKNARFELAKNLISE